MNYTDSCRDDAITRLNGYAMRLKFDWTLVGLSIALIFLLGLGAVALVAYFSLSAGAREPPALAWAPPWQVVDGAAVPPDLGLLPLAGDSVDSVVRRALDAGELDAGYALVVQDPSLTDSQRAGHLLLLGRRYVDAKRPDKAALCFRLAHEVAALSPALPDIARAETALQGAEGWLSLSQPGMARAGLDLVEALATSSPYLLDPQRVDLFSRLAAVYFKLDDRAKALALRETAGKLPARPLPPQRPPDLELDRLAGELVIPETLTNTVEARRQAVGDVINGLLAGRNLTDEDLQRLEPFLVAEDGARLAFYRQVIETQGRPSQQAAAQRALTDWLTFKLRASALDLQVSLVPAWEAERETIYSDLVAANANLFALYRDLASALPQAGGVSRARLEVLRSEILRGRLGLYPDYPQDELVQSLEDAQNDPASAPDGPKVVLIEVDGHPLFTLAQ